MLDDTRHIRSTSERKLYFTVTVTCQLHPPTSNYPGKHYSRGPAGKCTCRIPICPPYCRRVGRDGTMLKVRVVPHYNAILTVYSAAHHSAYYLRTFFITVVGCACWSSPFNTQKCVLSGLAFLVLSLFKVSVEDKGLISKTHRSRRRN